MNPEEDEERVHRTLYTEYTRLAREYAKLGGDVAVSQVYATLALAEATILAAGVER